MELVILIAVIVLITFKELILYSLLIITRVKQPPPDNTFPQPDLQRVQNFDFQTSSNSKYYTSEEYNNKFPEGLHYVNTFAAGEFICEECGQNSFYSVVTMAEEELSKEMAVELAQSPKTEDNRIIMHPNVVQCAHCKTFFYAGPLPEDDESDEFSDA